MAVSRTRLAIGHRQAHFAHNRQCGEEIIMARIKPFRGLRYNLERIPDMADVVCPPYDVITKHEQTALHDRSPYNVVRMELGRSYPDDDRGNNEHTRAGHYLRTWIDDGTLIRETKPALYLLATDFHISDGAWTRWGLLAAVAVEPFQQGGILPHERTYSKVKSERLSLMRACQANLSPIFAFFPDKKSAIPKLKAHAAAATPILDFRDENRHRHRLWVIDDPDLLDNIVPQFEHQPIFIADGHHRYETALAYRDERAAAEGQLPADHPGNYTLMYLSSIQDPGLKILPAHRLLPQVEPDLRRRFLADIEHFFDVQRVEANGSQGKQVQGLLQRLEQTLPGEGLIVSLCDVDTPLLLTLKPGKKNRIYAADIPDILKDIDVTLLSEFVFPKLLGLSPIQLDDVNCVHYHHDACQALERVTTGQYDMAFIIKPTPIGAVQRIADAGRVMPRKSTYFAPKVITGLVMHALFD